MAKRLWDKGGDINESILRFTAGDDPVIDLRLVRWDVIASAAHARMLHHIGILPSSELKNLLLALREILEMSDRGEFHIPLELEDCHTAIESILVEKCQDSGKRIHTGRSRNDQVLTAMRLYLRATVLEELEAMTGLIHSLLNRARCEKDSVMPGYTHLQAAMPSSIGMWLHAFAEALTKEHARGLTLLEELNTNPLGAAAGFGVPIPLDRQLTANALGFSQVQWNPIEAQNSRGRYELRVARFFGDIASHLEKLAWDFSLYTSQEFRFISLPREITTGSSIMPQKRNPDVVELIRARASRMRGRVAELEWVIAKLPSNYHRDFQYTKAPVFAVADDLSEMLGAMTIVINGFEVKTSALEAAMGDEVYATYDAFIQVRNGVPFRDAYRNTAIRLEQGQLDLTILKAEFSQIIEKLDSWIDETQKRLHQQTAQAQDWQDLLSSIETSLA